MANICIGWLGIMGSYRNMLFMSIFNRAFL